MIKPIDTYYNGNYFRSRLEARWAVFFEELGIHYQYEPEGYYLANGQCYLPDFFLPEFECFAEVKPDIYGVYHVSDPGYVKFSMVEKYDDYDKWVSFTQEKGLLLLIGNPHVWSMPFIPHKQEAKFIRDMCNFCFSPIDENRELSIDEKPLIEAVGISLRTKDDKDVYTIENCETPTLQWALLYGTGDEKYEDLEKAAQEATKKRFEHNP